MITFRKILFLAVYSFSVCGKMNEEGCTSLQYIEIGESGRVVCSFNSDFFGIFWYNTTDVSEEPVVILKKSGKSGKGYQSREFDVDPEGSLLIRNVSLDHEGNFTALRFKSTVDGPDVYVVQVKTFVKPSFPYPVVHGCADHKEVCFLERRHFTEISCQVSSCRPPIGLLWVRRTLFGDRNISGETSTFHEGEELYTSQASIPTHVFDDAQTLLVLVCKVDDPIELLQRHETQVLMLNSDESFPSEVAVSRFFEVETMMEVECGQLDQNFKYIMWIRLLDGVYKHLSYIVSTEGRFVKYPTEEYDITDDGSLVVRSASMLHEGLYYCIVGDGITERVIAREIVIYVQPVPPHMLIHGCQHQQNCVIETQNKTSEIACSLKGVRPKVQLQFRLVNVLTETYLESEDVITKRNGDTFDVTVVSTVHFRDHPFNKIKVECRVSAPEVEMFNISTVFHVLFVNGGSKENIVTSRESTSVFVFVLTFATALTLIILIVAGTIKVRRKLKQQSQQSRQDIVEETVPMKSTDEYQFPERGGDSTHENHSTEMDKYMLRENQDITIHREYEPLTVVILGKTGVGKSATANTILGDDIFKEDLKTVPVTRTSTSVTRSVDSRNISVVDTPGLFDPLIERDSCSSQRTTDHISKEIERILSFSPSGVDAFIYVFNLANPRFTKEDLQAIRECEDLFGGDIRHKRLLVYSHADSMTEMNFEQFWRRQTTGEEETTNYLKKFKQHVVATNNKSEFSSEKKKYREAIIALVDRLRAENYS